MNTRRAGHEMIDTRRWAEFDKQWIADIGLDFEVLDELGKYYFKVFIILSERTWKQPRKEKKNPLWTSRFTKLIMLYVMLYVMLQRN